MAYLLAIVSGPLPSLFRACATHMFAYIDPGTGSLVLQVLVGAVVGTLVTVKLYWQRVKMFFARRKAPDDAGGDSAT